MPVIMSANKLHKRFNHLCSSFKHENEDEHLFVFGARNMKQVVKWNIRELFGRADASKYTELCNAIDPDATFVSGDKDQRVRINVKEYVSLIMGLCRGTEKVIGTSAPLIIVNMRQWKTFSESSEHTYNIRRGTPWAV